MARPKYPSDKQDQFMVRLPEGMRDVLKYAAAENNRSMNAEIVSRLDASIVKELSGAETPALDAILEEVRATRRAVQEVNRAGFAAELLARLRSFDKDDPARLDFFRDMRMITRMIDDDEAD